MKKTVTRDGKYVIRVEIIPLKEGGFLAICPDLPGCLAQGKTIPRVLDYIGDVAEKAIELMNSEGLPIPEAITQYKKKSLRNEILVSVR